MSTLPDKLPPRRQFYLPDDDEPAPADDDNDELDNADACWLAQQRIEKLTQLRQHPGGGETT
jgi:hypothetical protein